MSEENSEHNKRLKKAKQIASNPEGYKICIGCDSIVVASVLLCPNCHAYRFDSTPTKVIEQALILGEREQSTVTPDDML